MEKTTKKRKITLPEVSVSYDCSPDGFIELVNVHRCGNMDAYKVDIIDKGKPKSVYITGIFVAQVAKAMGWMRSNRVEKGSKTPHQTT